MIEFVGVYTRKGETRITADEGYIRDLEELGFSRRKLLAPKEAAIFAEAWEKAWKMASARPAEAEPGTSQHLKRIIAQGQEVSQ